MSTLVAGARQGGSELPVWGTSTSFLWRYLRGWEAGLLGHQVFAGRKPSTRSWPWRDCRGASSQGTWLASPLGLESCGLWPQWARLKPSRLNSADRALYWAPTGLRPLKGGRQEVLATGGCPAIQQQEVLGGEEALEAAGPRCSRQLPAGGIGGRSQQAAFRAVRGIGPHPPGGCGLKPRPMAPEPHGLPGPQDTCLQSSARQEESHVLGQCHQVSGQPWGWGFGRWCQPSTRRTAEGGSAWEPGPSLGPRWAPAGRWPRALERRALRDGRGKRRPERHHCCPWVTRHSASSWQEGGAWVGRAFPRYTMPGQLGLWVLCAYILRDCVCGVSTSMSCACRRAERAV